MSTRQLQRGYDRGNTAVIRGNRGKVREITAVITGTGTAVTRENGYIGPTVVYRR